MDCTLNCPGYIPSRRSEDISDLPNPFVTNNKDSKSCCKKTKENVYKLKKIDRTDDIYFVLCFLLLILFFISKFT